MIQIPSRLGIGNAALDAVSQLSGRPEIGDAM